MCSHGFEDGLYIQTETIEYYSFFARAVYFENEKINSNNTMKRYNYIWMVQGQHTFPAMFGSQHGCEPMTATKVSHLYAYYGVGVMPHRSL